MKLELRPKFFSEVINIISQLVTEVNIKLSKEGLSITALDPASVAMVIFEMPKSVFVNYTVESDEILAVNLEDLKAVLKRMEKAEVIVLEKKDNMLIVSCKDGIKKHFTLALINIEEEERAKPKLAFTSSVELSSDLLADAVEDSLIIADSTSFITTRDSFKILTIGTLNRSEIEFSQDEVKISAVEDKAKYSLEYLEKFMKAAKLWPKVRLSFKTDHPLQLDYFGDSEAKLSFILAPRVEEE
ncbi:MAG: hypothetical protein QW244_01415 [Candidatus Pacearchaeota archaeon]